ncbi:hypothetical protein HYS82_02825 [Candidatus Amesbacteria bacterium]|nr:hypothetical protein [Candidatus Amesbacteria bacterium]
MASKKTITMYDIFKNPRYQGKHIVLINGKVFTANSGQGASKILKDVRARYPDQIPEVAYLPKAGFLILWA